MNSFTLTDINECTTTNLAHQHRCEIETTVCVNIHGSYECSCTSDDDMEVHDEDRLYCVGKRNDAFKKNK